MRAVNASCFSERVDALFTGGFSPKLYSIIHASRHCLAALRRKRCALRCARWMPGGRQIRGDPGALPKSYYPYPPPTCGSLRLVGGEEAITVRWTCEVAVAFASAYLTCHRTPRGSATPCFRDARTAWVTIQSSRGGRRSGRFHFPDHRCVSACWEAITHYVVINASGDTDSRILCAGTDIATHTRTASALLRESRAQQVTPCEC